MKKTLPFHPNGHQFSSDPLETVEVLVLEIGEETHNYLDRSRMSYSCFKCGGYRFEERVTDDGVHMDGEPCPVPDEGITTVITLEVPSGKIIVADNLRSVYNGFDRDKLADYNSVLGQAQFVEAMAKLGCAYGPVGNSCPTLWKTGEDTYIVARKPWLTGDEDEWADEDSVPAPEGAESLAGIITDLWAYCIADYDDWLAKGGKPVEELGWSVIVVEVPPGTYEFTHHSGEKSFDPDADHVVFADIKRIG